MAYYSIPRTIHDDIVLYNSMLKYMVLDFAKFVICVLGFADKASRSSQGLWRADMRRT